MPRWRRDEPLRRQVDMGIAIRTTDDDLEALRIS
jgi:hypothetical protein